MANNTEQFCAFDSTIKISSNKKEMLKTNRKAVRDRITKYYKDKHPDEISPSFWPQGSYQMDTILEPIKEEEDLGVFDLDDGAYFLDECDKRLSVSTYHNRIKEAVTGHTSKAPIDKNTCVRVEYADNHHIDIPIYFKEKGKDNIPKLAHKGKDWIDSDPREFYRLFNQKAKTYPQLRRLVRFLKAWCDYKEFCNNSINMPSGFILTILAINDFVSNERDDIALKELLVKVYNKLEKNFSCKRLTVPNGEELIADWSDSRKNDFMSRLKAFKDDAEAAIADDNAREASKKWQNHFGDRFPLAPEAKDEKKHTALNELKNKILAGTAAISRSGTIVAENGVRNLPHRNFGE